MQKFRLVLISNYILVTLSFVPAEAGSAETQGNLPIRMLVLSVGDIGIDDDLERPNIVGIDYRMLPFSEWDLIPAIGYVYKDGGASYVYIDLRYDYWFSNDWVLVPSYGVGYFDKDDELDLGGELEFRAGIEISHRFDNKYRLGLAVFHLSNGRLYGSNPGTEALAVSLSIPLND